MFTFYTNSFIPNGYDAYTRGPFVFVRPEHKNDLGLIAHEKVHVRQWFCTLMLHPLLYLISDKYKLNSEVEAYKEQLKHYPKSTQENNLILFSGYLANNYNLNITQDEAMLELTK
jgi:hypothetical protein